MNRRIIIIMLMTFCISFGVAAQSALAIECDRMMNCMPAHNDGHLPGAGDDHSCDCDITPMQFSNAACSSSKRNVTAPAVKSYPDIDHGLLAEHGNGWITRDKGERSYHIAGNRHPFLQCPAYILYQSLLN